MINLDYIKNNVDAEHQVKFPFYFYGVNQNGAKLKIMFIGNSITLHEPNSKLGWNRTCGMAASDANHDYVHLVTKFLKSREPNLRVCVFNGGQWELDFQNEDKLNVIINVAKEFSPDIIVVRIGENFNRNLILNQIDPFPYFNSLLSGLKKISNNIITTSLFWHVDIMDKAIKKSSDLNNTKYVYIADLGDDNKYKAIGEFADVGVQLHPNNLGMENIAKRIIEKI